LIPQVLGDSGQLVEQRWLSRVLH